MSQTTADRLLKAAAAGWTDIKVLPCGCVLGDELRPDGGTSFGIVPCSLRCTYFEFALDESARQGKPLETRTK